MEQHYHITVFDSFHRHEPEEAWVSGTYATAEAAIAAVKRKIDSELAYLWSEVCHQDKGISTLDRLISHYNFFADVPVAFSHDHKMIFDSTEYMKSRAAEMVDEAPAPYLIPVPAPHFLQPTKSHGLQRKRPPKHSVSRPAKPDAAAAKPRFPRIAAVWTFIDRPRHPTLLVLAFFAVCLLIGLIRQVVLRL